MALIRNDLPDGYEPPPVMSDSLRVFAGIQELSVADRAFSNSNEPDKGINVDALKTKLLLASWTDRLGLDRPRGRQVAREAARLARSLGEKRCFVQAELIHFFGWRGGWLAGPLR